CTAARRSRRSAWGTKPRWAAWTSSPFLQETPSYVSDCEADSIMLEPYPVQRCADQRRRVGVVYAGRGGECQSAPPTLRRFRMYPREDHPSVSDVSFN